VREKLVPLIVSVGALIVLLIALVPGKTGTPEQTVYATVEKAKTGDTRGYIACFDGELKQQLQAALAESGREQFRQNISERAGQMTGIAVSRPAEIAPDATEALLRVELVFRDRNEEQEYCLRRSRRGWKIVTISPARTVEMPIPYGTLVYPEPPPATAETGGTQQQDAEDRPPSSAVPDSPEQ